MLFDVMTQHKVDRRGALKATVGAGLTAGFGAGFLPGATSFAAASPRTGALDFSKAEDNVTAIVKLQTDLEGKETQNWFSGSIMAVIGDDTQIQPILGFEGFGTSRSELQPDGTYRKFLREVAYYKDLRTNEILEEWANPFIDETVKIFHVHNDPVNMLMAPEFEMDISGKVTKFPFVLPWIVMGDDAMVSVDINTRAEHPLSPEEWPRESTGKFMRVSEYFQFYASLSDLNNPNVTNAPYVGGWQRSAPWLPWMLMGGQPGHLFYRTHTRKLASLDELPRHIYDYTQKHYPDYFTAPSQWGIPNVSSFEVYKKESSPAQ